MDPKVNLFYSIWGVEQGSIAQSLARLITYPGPEVIKPFFSCSTQLSMKFSLLINMKMPTIVGIFIFICREIFMLSYVKQERSCKY